MIPSMGLEYLSLLGTLHINMILDKATLEEIKNLPAAWRRGSIGSMVLCREAVLETESLTMIIKAPVKLNKAITIPGLQVSKLSGHSQNACAGQKAKCNHRGVTRAARVQGNRNP